MALDAWHRAWTFPILLLMTGHVKPTPPDAGSSTKKEDFQMMTKKWGFVDKRCYQLLLCLSVERRASWRSLWI